PLRWYVQRLVDRVRSGGEALTLRRLVREAVERGEASKPMLIGTFCAEHGFQIVHNDSDFDSMARHIGLEVL
ncbi:MAG: hypothetical protein ACFFKA_06485, partial [Candidatus Thorarchaeota archaeon]